MAERLQPVPTRDRDPLAAIERLPVTRRADQVVDRIRDLIVDELLAVGDRLPSERTLADRFGTSRAIVSQALRTLSLMGLVEIRPGSGAYVTRNPAAMLSDSVGLLVRVAEGDPTDIADLRYVLETAGASRAMAHPERIDVELMAGMLQRMDDSRGRLSSWVFADTSFHAALVHGADNGYLSAVYDSVHTAVISVTYDEWVSRDAPPRWFTANFDHQLDLHRDIFRAVEAKDAGRLERALLAHHEALLDHLDAGR